MTNEELLEEWHAGEKRQKELWQEILKRGLYFQSLGINPSKRDSAWRNPPVVSVQGEKDFYRNVTGKKYYKRPENRPPKITAEDLKDFD